MYRYYGGINYNNAWKAAAGAQTILDSAEEAIKNRKFSKAVLMVQTVIEEIGPEVDGELYDEEGEFYSVVYRGFEIIKNCCGCGLDEETRKNLFSYAIKEAMGTGSFYYHNWFTEWIETASIIGKDGEIDTIFTVLDKAVKQEKGKESYCSSEKQLLNFQYDLLKSLKGEEEAQLFFEKNLYVEEFREKAINAALDRKEWDSVIRLCSAGEEQDQEEKGLVTKWRHFRMLAYIGKNDIENMRSLGLFFITENYDLKYFDQVKNSYLPDRWQAVFQELIDGFTNRSFPSYKVMADIFVKEKDWESLLSMVKENPMLIDDYKKYLLPGYADSVYSIYAGNIKKNAARADKRKAYRRVCHDLRDLIQMGGKHEAQELITYFRAEYARRPAFIDEIDMIGKKRKC